MKEIFAEQRKIRPKRNVKHKDGLSFERFPAYDTPTMKAFICKAADHAHRILMVNKETKDERYLFEK